MPQVRQLAGDVPVDENYEQLAENWHIDNAIAEAEAEYNQSGILLDADEVFEKLRRKHFE